MVPCHAIHFRESGCTLWGSTCKGCSPIAHAKLAAWRTGVVAAAVPVGVVAGLAVAGAATVGGAAYCTYKVGKKAGEGTAMILGNCTQPVSAIEEEVDDLDFAEEEVLFDYAVSLDRSNGEKLGLDVVRNARDELIILKINTEGLAEDWNQSQDQPLLSGHIIVEVNGLREVNGMLAACRLDQHLEIKLRRS